MTAGDVETLDELLTRDFTLTHITGYCQPRAEWLAEVRDGTMTYHSVVDVAITVDVGADAPVLTARTRTEATIWGSYGTWPLQLVIHLVRTDGRWRAAHVVASTW